MTIRDVNDKELKEILTEMCNRVGAVYSEIDFKKEEWFYEYEWTMQEQEQFKEWLDEYLKRKRVVTNKHYREKKVDWFIFYCGWKCSDENYKGGK